MMNSSKPIPGVSRRRLLVAALVALVLHPFSGPAAATAPDFADKLPVTMGEWRRPAQPTTYNRKTLYDYIDGGAELYLAFGFVEAMTFEYSAGKDDEIKVDIFDMGTPYGAYGAFAHGRESVAAEVGQGSDYGGGLLTFWKHRWFVSVLGYPETDSKRKAVYDLGQAIAGLITETGEVPGIIASLPKPGLIEASVRTFNHPLLQNDYVTLSHENPLGIGPATQAVLARYRRHGDRHVLLLIEYATEGEAKRGQSGFRKNVLGAKSVAKKGGGWMGVKRAGKRLIVVLEASSRQSANHVLSEMP